MAAEAVVMTKEDRRRLIIIMTMSDGDPMVLRIGRSNGALTVRVSALGEGVPRGTAPPAGRLADDASGAPPDAPPRYRERSTGTYNLGGPPAAPCPSQGATVSDATAAHPRDEEGRLQAVHRYDVLDTPPDGAFDRVTRLAAALLQMPIAIVTIVDHDRIWFKARHGLEVEEIGRDPGLCASAILQDETWVIEDALRDPRTLANPIVAGELGLQFYAGAPLRTHDGYNLGTLCVIDREPRHLGPNETRLLEDLAGVVMDELELRLAARRADAAVRERTALLDERQRQAIELNDDVVQCLVVTKMSLEIGDDQRVAAQIDHALAASKRILASMAQDAPSLRRDQRGKGSD